MGNADRGWPENAEVTLGASRDVDENPLNAEVEAGWDAKAEDAALARLENVLLENGLLGNGPLDNGLLWVLNTDTGWDCVPNADTGCWGARAPNADGVPNADVDAGAPNTDVWVGAAAGVDPNADWPKTEPPWFGWDAVVLVAPAPAPNAEGCPEKAENPPPPNALVVPEPAKLPNAPVAGLIREDCACEGWPNAEDC